MCLPRKTALRKLLKGDEPLPMTLIPRSLSKPIRHCRSQLRPSIAMDDCEYFSSALHEFAPTMRLSREGRSTPQGVGPTAQVNDRV